MELNREQIIKALEECGAKTTCNDCPLVGDFDLRMPCQRKLCLEAHSLIKELTQSNEQLSESYDHLEKTKDELLSERSRLCIELEAMRTAANSYKMHNEKLTEENKAWQMQLISQEEKASKAYYDLACEVEDLRADIAKEFTCVFGQPHKVTDCPIDDEIAKAKADTVREIFDLVECAFSPVLVYEGQTIKRYIAELKKKYAKGGTQNGQRQVSEGR